MTQCLSVRQDREEHSRQREEGKPPSSLVSIRLQEWWESQQPSQGGIRLRSSNCFQGNWSLSGLRQGASVMELSKISSSATKVSVPA